MSRIVRVDNGEIGTIVDYWDLLEAERVYLVCFEDGHVAEYFENQIEIVDQKGGEKLEKMIMLVLLGIIFLTSSSTVYYLIKYNFEKVVLNSLVTIAALLSVVIALLSK